MSEGFKEQKENFEVNPEVQEKSYEYTFFPDERQRFLFGEAVEVAVDLVKENSSQSEESNVIFLDKSARPIATAFSELWNLKYKGSGKPHISFLNIGRELSEDQFQSPGKKTVVITPGIEKEIERIQNEYVYLKEASAGSVVTIIDDIESSGFTEKASLKILEKAFPDLTFKYHPLAKARKDQVSLERYDKEKSKLFDHEVVNLTGKNGIATVPPWKTMGWSMSPEGTTGVIDSKETSLTSAPYYSYEKYSDEKREKIQKRHARYNEGFVAAQLLVAEGCRELLDWKPELGKKGSKDYNNILKDIEVFKKQAETFLSNVGKVGPNALFDMAPQIPESFALNYSESRTSDESKELRKEVWEKLGIEGAPGAGQMGRFMTKEGSIAGKLYTLWDEFRNANEREKFELEGKELQINELVPQLREEIKRIVNEYWLRKNNLDQN